MRINSINQGWEMRKKENRGFTLMGLIATVIILSVLVGVAIPTYRRTIDRSYWRQAKDILLTIYNAQQAYFYTQEPNTYFIGTLGVTSSHAQWGAIFMDNPNIGATPEVVFSVTSDTFDEFVATAARGTNVMTINQERMWCGDPGVEDPADCPAGTWPWP